MAAHPSFTEIQMTHAQTNIAARFPAALQAARLADRITDASEIAALLRLFAFGFADDFGADRAMAHISSLLEQMPPLINLSTDASIDPAAASRQIRGIQEILVCARGRLADAEKLGFIRRLLDDQTWGWDGKAPRIPA